ncbi:uncharacterized mitochondrial protein AtMg00310-like [Rutidosis leptorrhynchoides]|uniref:uncharacterized mitochondrial protein AtMg00310-like n=1 Tax=Rutidosis leptorrhynchoides TaxID=125765 RepID=UPI003A995A79
MAIIKDIEKLLRGFLWCQGEFKNGKAKVKWDDVCMPKDENGLGIKSLKYWNIALMASHLWRLMTSKQSLWVHWIHEYRLANYNLWDVKVKPDASWSWQKLLNIRNMVRKFFIFNIGDGKCASAWFDNWNPVGLLADFIPIHVICVAGYGLNEKVRDFFNDDGPNWPNDWYNNFPSLHLINMPQFSNSPNQLGWKSDDQIIHGCSIAIVWYSIRPSGPIVPWFDVVWFSNCIPKHAFVMWLLMGRY